MSTMLATRPPYLKNLFMTPPCCGLIEVEPDTRRDQAPGHPLPPPVLRRIPPDPRSGKTRSRKVVAPPEDRRPTLERARSAAAGGGRHPARLSSHAVTD